jgi:S-formylglutathione hydrolase FrmB
MLRGRLGIECRQPVRARPATAGARRLRSVLLAACGALALVPAGASAASTFADGYGLHVLSVKQLDTRLLEVTVQSAALPGPATVRVLLPADYESTRPRRFPVLYLLHGTSGGAADWTVKGEAEQTTAGRELIVVMPDVALNDNGGGWCTNWVNGGSYGVPEWERFHIDELIPWIDRNLRTIAARKGRAIAGLSQGGFCSTSYAARHPDLFSTVLGYSGAPDIAFDKEAAVGATAIINATEVGLDNVPPDSMFGDPVTDEVNWATHDPATLANNLRGLNIRMYWGNGEPGPLDPSPPEAGTAGGSSIEALVNQDNIYFRKRLQALAIPAFYNAYGPGTHSWPYWTRDLQESIGPVMEAFAQPPATPKQVTYTTAESSYSAFGWSVAMHRTAEEFSTLENASASGFALAGSGAGMVLTPPKYAPGASYSVTLAGPYASASETVTARADRRLLIEVPLGPSNPYQEYTAEAEATGTAVYTTAVTIKRP